MNEGLPLSNPLHFSLYTFYTSLFIIPCSLFGVQVIFP